MSKWVTLKRAIVGSVLLAAISVVPAFAASATISDAGSSYWTARVNGSGFTPSGIFTAHYAYVLIENIQYDENGYVVADDYVGDWVQTSTWMCFRFSCWSGGTFQYERYMAPLQCGQRWATAYDDGTGIWTPWIQLDCA